LHIPLGTLTLNVEVIFEKRQNITEVGAGIQLAPNAARILRRFGVLDEAMKHATALEGITSK
jgi:salicylate hydroxylase